MASLETPTKHLTSIVITPPPPPPSAARICREFTEEEFLKEQRVLFPLFRPIRERRKNAWVISFFVALQLLAFLVAMYLNDLLLGICPCQPLTMDEMEALRKMLFTEHHRVWRLLSSPWLHAGFFHLIVNLSCILFVGIRLEQEFGTSKIALVYVLSAAYSSLAAMLIIQDIPDVTSGALFGLLGAMLSVLIQNWRTYFKKWTGVASLLIIFTMNLLLGLLPYINKFSSMGGFIFAFLLGVGLLGKPRQKKVTKTKAGLSEYEVKDAARRRFNVDMPLIRGVSLVIFCLVLVGGFVAVIKGLIAHCSWCSYFDCVPANRSCSRISVECFMSVERK